MCVLSLTPSGLIPLRLYPITHAPATSSLWEHYKGTTVSLLMVYLYIARASHSYHHPYTHPTPLLCLVKSCSFKSEQTKAKQNHLNVTLSKKSS